MIISWEGKAYSLDFADLDLHQAEVIEKEAGMPLAQFLDTIGAGTSSLALVKIVYWLMLAQNGEEVPLATVNFRLLPFAAAFAAAMAAEPGPAPEAADPTQTAPPGQTSPSPPDPPTQETSRSEEGAPLTVS